METLDNMDNEPQEVVYRRPTLGKPAVQSLGMVANGSGVLLSVAGLALSLGASPVVLPVAVGITSVAHLVAHVCGWMGRKRAKQQILGWFRAGTLGTWDR